MGNMSVSNSEIFFFSKEYYNTNAALGLNHLITAEQYLSYLNVLMLSPSPNPVTMGGNIIQGPCALSPVTGEIGREVGSGTADHVWLTMEQPHPAVLIL